MSGSHKKILRRLNGIEQNLNGLNVDQKVKIDIMGLCPASNLEFENVKNNIIELTNLIEGLFASVSEIANLLKVIQDQVDNDLPKP